VSTTHAPPPQTALKPRRRGALVLRPEGSVQEVSHQFEDQDQQNESYLVGMWAFLVTEIMFFGGLFFAYTIYRTRFADTFRVASQELDWKLGFLNTLILLTSSLSMAFAVRNAQLARKGATLRCLAITLACAFGFLGVKSVEYTTKWNHHLVPGASFHFSSHHAAKGEGHVASVGQAAEGESAAAGVGEHAGEAVNQQQAQLFFGIYFATTGLHAVHIIIGIGLMLALGGLITFNSPAVRDYMPIEMVGLYWHFVDIVWIFLYPLLYLIHPVA